MRRVEDPRSSYCGPVFGEHLSCYLWKVVFRSTRRSTGCEVAWDYYYCQRTLKGRDISLQSCIQLASRPRCRLQACIHWPRRNGSSSSTTLLAILNEAINTDTPSNGRHSENVNGDQALACRPGRYFGALQAYGQVPKDESDPQSERERTVS